MRPAICLAALMGLRVGPVFTNDNIAVVEYGQMH